jgi:hypothetical protein
MITYEQRVNNIQCIADLDKQIKLAKGMVTRSRNASKNTTITLDEKIKIQKDTDFASGVLRKLRVNYFDIEDSLQTL